MIRLARPWRGGELPPRLKACVQAYPALGLGIVCCTVLLAAALGGVAGVAFGRISGVPASDRASYRDARAQTVGAHLRQFEGDYILTAGDSHIEHWYVGSLCGLPVVNAGLSGATAHSYAGFFSELPLSRPPRAIVLTIGTNDAQRRRIGDPDETIARFQAAAGVLLGLLGAHAPLVVATAVPPLDPGRAASFSPRMAARFSGILETVCRAHGCRFVDPFQAGTPLVDGVHLKDYAGVYAGLGSDLCRALAEPPAIRTAGGTQSTR